MQLHHPAAPSTLVKPINVLGDDGDLGLASTLLL